MRGVPSLVQNLLVPIAAPLLQKKLLTWTQSLEYCLNNAPVISNTRFLQVARCNLFMKNQVGKRREENSDGSIASKALAENNSGS